MNMFEFFLWRNAPNGMGMLRSFEDAMITKMQKCKNDEKLRLGSQN